MEGDGRCGFRAIARWLGLSCVRVMQALSACMLAHPSTCFDDQDVTSMMIASNEMNPCSGCAANIPSYLSTCARLAAAVSTWHPGASGCCTPRGDLHPFSAGRPPRSVAPRHQKPAAGQVPSMHFGFSSAALFLLLGVAPFGPCSFTGVRTHPQGCRCRVTPALTVLRYAISFYNTATLCPTSKIIRAASCNLAGVPHASSRQLSLHASRSLPLHSCFVAVPLRAATAPSEAIMYFFQLGCPALGT